MDRQTALNGEQSSTLQFEVVSGDEERKALLNQLSRNFGDFRTEMIPTAHIPRKR
jgi:hypothetical protein